MAMDGSDALHDYWAILSGELSPQFLRARAFHVELDLSAPLGELWRAHDEALQAFHLGGTGKGSGPSLLDLKVELGCRQMAECTLCERRCKADRTAGKLGFCKVGQSRVATMFLHLGEEPQLVPSLTIFFSGCTFRCAFCQNWDISTDPLAGTVLPPERLAAAIARTLDSGGLPRNVNWVGGEPTPNLPYILEVLRELPAGIPQVWNSNMYLTAEGMALLDGVMDVYLTDFKYGSDPCALRLSKVPRYLPVVSRNHARAADQGELLIRHLVMPNHLDCCTRPVLRWIGQHTPQALVNVMDQYRPEHRAGEHPDIARRLKMAEWREAMGYAEQLGLTLV